MWEPVLVSRCSILWRASQPKESMWRQNGTRCFKRSTSNFMSWIITIFLLSIGVSPTHWSTFLNNRILLKIGFQILTLLISTKLETPNSSKLLSPPIIAHKRFNNISFKKISKIVAGKKIKHTSWPKVKFKSFKIPEILSRKKPHFH